VTCAFVPDSLFAHRKCNQAWIIRRSICAWSAALLLLGAACPRGAGQSVPSFVVNNGQFDAGPPGSQCGATTGPGTCSLRDALAAASSAGSGNITFDETVFSSGGTIVLADGPLLIPPNTTITGPAPTLVNGVMTPVVTVSGNYKFQVFVFAPSQSTATAAIANMGIVKGSNLWTKLHAPWAAAVLPEPRLAAAAFTTAAR
jgi:hypothetical protein